MNKIIVLEVQVGFDGTIGTLINDYEDRNVAENKYHNILAAAAVSNLAIHTAFMLDPKGKVLKADHYEHKQVEE